MVYFICTLSLRKLFHTESKCVQIEEVHRVLFTMIENCVLNLFAKLDDHFNRTHYKLHLL